jgi:hypothetical protein
MRYMYLRREKEKQRLLAEGYVTPAGEFTDRSPEFKYQF